MCPCPSPAKMGIWGDEGNPSISVVGTANKPLREKA